MNHKFFKLPKEKQTAIVNAGYRIFSLTSYRKTPVGEIAKEAKISKSLLFYYFQNKKDLYLYLWNHAASITSEELDLEQCYDKGNLFDRMEKGMEAKLRLVARYPHMSNFVLRAFYEKDGDIKVAIQESYVTLFAKKEKQMLASLDAFDYKEGIDLEMMIQQMYWAAEGYLWQKVHEDQLDIEEMEQDF